LMKILKRKKKQAGSWSEAELIPPGSQ